MILKYREKNPKNGILKSITFYLFINKLVLTAEEMLQVLW